MLRDPSRGPRGDRSSTAGACLVAEDLAEVDGRLLISQRAVEGRRPPGRQRDQRAVPGGRPLLEGAHQSAADAAAALLAAYEDLLDPARRPVGVEGEVPETQQVPQWSLPVGGQQQAGVAVREQRRVAEAEPGPGERERLRQPGGQVRDRIRVTSLGRPDLANRVAHRPMMAYCARADVPRAISSIGSSCRSGRTRSPRSSAHSRCAPSVPLRASGWWIVLRLRKAADSMSSKPITDSPPGTGTPSRSAAASTPMAWVSEAAKIAVGGWADLSSWTACSAAAAASCGPRLIRPGSGSMPAAARACRYPRRRCAEEVKPSPAGGRPNVMSPTKPIRRCPSSMR